MGANGLIGLVPVSAPPDRRHRAAPALRVALIKKAEAVPEADKLLKLQLDIGGETVFARYRKSDGVLTILWVESPPALRGTGAAGRLMKLLGAEARAKGWSVVPVCGYAAAWLRRSPEFRDLVAA